MLSAKLISFVSLLATPFSGPVLEAPSCNPNFGGRPLTIFKTRLALPFQWNPTNSVGGHITLNFTKTPFADSEFLVAFSGQPDNSYVFKMTADTAHNLQLQGFANGDLTFQPIKFTGNTQNFGIDCFTCATTSDIADGCTVKHVQTGLCVTDNGNGSTLKLTTCTGGFNQAAFNFHSP